MVDIALTDNADVYVTLLTTKDAPDTDVETDGTTIAETYSGARIVDVNLKLILHGGTAGDRTEIVYYKDRDAALGASWTVALLFDQDYTVNTAAIRNGTMWYDMHVWGSGSDKNTLMPRVRRAAMARNAQLRENDNLKILFSQNDGSTTRKLSMVGRLTTVA